jgi:tol-pal system beta propeller repeat protein TolB
VKRLLVTAVIACVLAGCSGGEGSLAPTKGETTTTAPQTAAGKIAYHSYVEGDTEIYVMNTDGSGQVALTENTTDDDRFPTWSPDGSQIAFERGPAFPSTHPEYQIYVINGDGSGEVRLTRGGVTSGPAWSPDGSKIAFGHERDIYAMNTDGSGMVRLTNSKRYASGKLEKQLAQSWAPAWSPDGTKIAFLSDRAHLDVPAIYLMDSDGSHETRLIAGEGSEGSPSWSPDGQRLAFAGRATGKHRLDIHVINADGTGDTTLGGSTKTSSNADPAWSPDGTQIAFLGEGDEGGALHVIRADGSGLRRLVAYSFGADPPAWTPDGTKLILARGYLEFDEQNNAYYDIVSIDLASGRLTTLIPKEGEAWGPVVTNR